MLKPSLQLRLGQQLTMTPQLQQAIRLLQLPTLDLQAQIREALESNIMLEAEEDQELGPSLDDYAGSTDSDVEGNGPDADETVVEIGEDWTEPTATAGDSPWSGSDSDDDRANDIAGQGETLHDHLGWQLELARLSPRDLAIGRAIVDAINDDGYLTESVESLAAIVRPEFEPDVDEVEAVLRVVQQFDPVGVGARGPGECIELQLAQLDPATPGLALAIDIAHRHLELVATQQYAPLRRELRCSQEDLDQALALVRACHPRPGASMQSQATEYVVPDVFVRRSEYGWVVELNPSAVPRIRINAGYAGLITRASEHAVLRSQLQEARWLLRSLEIRNETLMKVARTIVQRQAAFLEQGEESMQPMVLKDVAAAIDMHESTISRVTTGKYMHTPRGVFEFRFFFSSHVAGEGGTEVSSTAIRAKIRKLIAQEAAESPLSDSRIAEILSKDGVQVARRTVAKYREAMGIASSGDRRRAAPR
jgi:RNA polymerase sigma-54 factor